MNNSLSDITLSEFTLKRNAEKVLFTAGPASLLVENLTGLCPCFGRDDGHYEALEKQVLERLLLMTGHQQIVRLQGSATLALEIAALNFLEGKVLVVSSGYYSGRLSEICSTAQRMCGFVKNIQSVPWTDMAKVSGAFDWIVACYTETSRGILLPIQQLRHLADRTGAKLLLDATASIGLESDHDAAEVIAYSSCKGLFGLTGGAFIAYSTRPQNEVPSFYLRLETHVEKRVTGPYHAIASLSDVMDNHAFFRESVLLNKQKFILSMRNFLTQPDEYQPKLCTHVSRKLKRTVDFAVTYTPRGVSQGSVVCHLGEAHLGARATGGILELLEWD